MVKNRHTPGITAPPPDNELSLSEEIQGLHYYWDMAGAKDVEELNAKVEKILNELGFSDFTYSRLGAEVVGDGSGQLLYSEGAMPEIVNEYQLQQLYTHDYVLKHLNFKSTPIYLSSVEEQISGLSFDNEEFRRNYEVYRLCNYFNLKDVYDIPLNSVDGEGRVVLAVSIKGVSKAVFSQHVEQKKKELYLLAKAVDYIGVRKFPDYFIGATEEPAVVVSPRPLQLLQVMAKENLLLKDAASRLCIGLDTANKHMAAVKRALGASTPASAVYRAIKEGLISCD